MNNSNNKKTLKNRKIMKGFFQEMDLIIPKIKVNPGKLVKVRTTPKINRNEQCPCGSGNKYKNCCLK